MRDGSYNRSDPAPVSFVATHARATTVEDLPQPPAWFGGALCAQTDPDAFFPEQGGSTRSAKTVCASCDVRQKCLEYALENDERFGIWGGKSERERRKLRDKRGRNDGLLPAVRLRREETIRALNAGGRLDVEIGERMGLSAQTVSRMRRDLGLPRNRNVLPKVGRS